MLGVFQLNSTGPCPSGNGLVFSWAADSPATTDAGLNTSSFWPPLAELQCNAAYPAVGGGPSGLGVLFTNDTSLAGVTQFRKFTAPGTFAPAVTVAGGDRARPVDLAGRRRRNLRNLAHKRRRPSARVQLRRRARLESRARTLVAADVGAPASAVGPGGQGWAVYAANGTEYAQPFVAADANVSPSDHNLRVVPSSFSSSATIHYTDSEAAKTTFTVVKLKKGHRVTVGTFAHTDLAGPNSVPFPFHALVRGHYMLKVTPTLGALTGKAVVASFAVT